MKKLFLFPTMTFLFTLSVCAQNNNAHTARQGETMRIKITVGSDSLTATMADNTAAHDFLSLLPLTLTLEDYNRTEKISSLPRRLSTTGVPDGYDPSVGDICYYAPWGNIAIFYRDFGYARGLVHLGRIDSGIEAFNVSGSLIAQFEVME